MAIFKVIHRNHYEYFGHIVEQKYHDDSALKNVIEYCYRPDKTPHQYIGGIGVNPQYAVEQMEAVALAYRKASGLRLRHMLLSFDKHERISFQRAKLLAFQLASYYGYKYQIIYAVHEDKANKHIHFVMNTVSYLDGHKYAGHRDDYYRFQEYMRSVLAGEFGFRLNVVPDSIQQFPAWKSVGF